MNTPTIRPTAVVSFSKIHGVKDNDSSTKLLNAAATALDRASKVEITTEDDESLKEVPAKFRTIITKQLNADAHSSIDDARIAVYESHRAHKLALAEAFSNPTPDDASKYTQADLSALNRETLEIRKILEARKVLPVRM